MTPTPVQRGDLILLSQKIFWWIVEEWNTTIFKELEEKGMADDRSRWNIITADNGEIVIYNECVTAKIFDAFNQKFFARISPKFGDNWRKVERLPFESGWGDYVPSSGPNNRSNFKQFGWKMKESLFSPRSDEDTSEYTDTQPSSVVLRVNMDNK